MRKIILCLVLTAAMVLAAPAERLGLENGSTALAPRDGGNSVEIAFEDDFETGDLSVWEVSEATDYSLSDSPGADYLPDTDSWAAFNSNNPIDLSGTTSPTLTFWWYGKYFLDWDYMQVQVSTNGSDWDVVWDTIATDEETEWTEVNVDLSAYAGSSVYLRFFVHSSSVVEYDGGHFNNLMIFDGDSPIYANSCNTMDDIVTGGNNDTWDTEDEGVAEQWMCSDLYPYDGIYHAAGGPVFYDNNLDSYMAVMNVDLADCTTAELACYLNWDPADGGDILTLEADNGGGWEVVDTLASTADYEERIVTLDDYTGDLVDLRFHLVTDGSGNGIVPLIDDVVVSELDVNIVPTSWGQIKTLD